MLDSGGGLDYLGGEAPKRRRFRRAAPSILCVVLAVILMAMIGDADVDTGNLWAIPAGALFFTAVTIPAWRRGGPENTLDGQAMRVLRLHWRLHLRASIVLFYVGMVLLWIASYAHYEYSDQYSTTDPVTDSARYNTFSSWSLWFLVAAAIPVLISPLTWRLWPASIRMAVREARAARYSFQPRPGVPPKTMR